MKKLSLLLFAFLGIQCGSDNAASNNACGTTDVQYLAFQVFVSGTTEPAGDYQALNSFISNDKLEDFFKTVQAKTGNAELPCRKSAVIVGPLALDFSNTDIALLIGQSFSLAKKYNIAVGFHIDDGMYWANRKDLWQNPDNVEWIDWNGTPNTSRYVDWVSAKLAPQMCFNAPGVKLAAKDFTTNIAVTIKSNVDQLNAVNKAYLYAGTFVGWETSLDKDRDTQKSSGYHALSNKGFGSANLPADIDGERVKLLREYIEWLAAPLLAAGLPVDKPMRTSPFYPGITTIMQSPSTPPLPSNPSQRSTIFQYR